MRELRSKLEKITDDQDNLKSNENGSFKKSEVKKHFDNLNVKEKLLKLKNAYESGLLSKEEYEKKRRKILDEEVGTIN